jgi:hypothetical protein
MTQPINIWVDPACPFAWMTAQWMLEVEKVRDVEMRVNLMSLAVLNEGRDDLSPEYRDALKDVIRPVRVGIAVERAHGKDALRAYYLAAATLRHNDGAELDDAGLARALESAGLDASLAAAADDGSLDGDVRESHHAGMDAVGQDVGTPVLHFPRPDGGVSAFFGPVIAPPPTGDDAGRLWDGLMLVATTDGLYELKRSRDTRPSFLPMQELSTVS